MRGAPTLGPWLALVVLALGCDQERLTIRAEGCWGQGAPDASACAGRQAPALGALGLLGARIPELRDSALQLAPAAVVPGRTVSAAPTRTRDAGQIPAPTPGLTTPASDSMPATPSPGTTANPPPPPTPTPPKANGGEAVALAGENPCRGVALAGVEQKQALAGGELLCLQAIARGKAPATDPELQAAATALYNIKASGWTEAVEAALGRPSVANAPLLNFAAIKPAYDGRRYNDVLRRAGVVWKNLDKGYQLGAADRTFVVEFACRSAGQLALAGKAPGDGLDWCERWKDRAVKDGLPTGPIDDLIRQLE